MDIIDLYARAYAIISETGFQNGTLVEFPLERLPSLFRSVLLSFVIEDAANAASPGDDYCEIYRTFLANNSTSNAQVTSGGERFTLASGKVVCVDPAEWAFFLRQKLTDQGFNVAETNLAAFQANPNPGSDSFYW